MKRRKANSSNVTHLSSSGTTGKRRKINRDNLSLCVISSIVGLLLIAVLYYYVYSNFFPNEPIEINDDVDLIDFSSHKNMEYAYRIGDVFVVWYLLWLSWDQLVDRYASHYPNTLAHGYLLETGQPEYALRNISALLKVMDRKESHMHYRRARPDELIVHLRLGDVLTDSEYIDVNIPIQQLWDQEEGFLCFDADVKYNYNKKEYKLLISRIMHPERIKNCVFVGASFISIPEYDHRNTEYLNLVTSLFQEELGCEISFHSASNPDKDLMFMASAHVIITAMGGYAQIAAACVKAKGNDAIYDKFNGQIAGWIDERFTENQVAIYSESYIDWSRVDYVPLQPSKPKSFFFRPIR